MGAVGLVGLGDGTDLDDVLMGELEMDEAVVLFTGVGDEMDEELDLFLSFLIKCSAPPRPFRRSVPPTAFIY